ncbi:MAG: hypothetical protein KKC28_14665 [Verrucomicrobia bacterium]|nr:hypothetical protein [Verrucomicrobiota bacterium]
MNRGWIIFSLFPSQWELPVPRRQKPIKSLSDYHFPPQPVTAKIPRPVPSPVKASVKYGIPACEMLKPGEEVDTSEVDRMLAEMDNPSQDTKAQQIFQMVEVITQNIDKSINILKENPAEEGGAVIKEELLRLLQMFSKYSHALENYIKEQTPSSF